MQLAGVSCSICKENVRFDSDATWCARCSTVLHRQCLEQANAICPACKLAYDPPESHFVFSQQCPECFRLNDPPQPQCGRCAARTRWDTQAAYDEFMAHMKDASRVRALRGLAELVGGALCLIAFVSLLSIGRLSFLLLFGFMALTADGMFNFTRSRRIANFR